MNNEKSKQAEHKDSDHSSVSAPVAVTQYVLAGLVATIAVFVGAFAWMYILSSAVPVSRPEPVEGEVPTESEKADKGAPNIKDPEKLHNLFTVSSTDDTSRAERVLLHDKLVPPAWWKALQWMIEKNYTNNFNNSNSIYI